jgi:hypothetical protein
MALTENQVKEIFSEAGCPAENIDSAVKKIMAGHVTSINALREQRDLYKVDAEKLPDVQKELDDLKAKGDQDWQQKYETEHENFEDYKVQIAAEKEKQTKSSLYSALLKECKVDESRISSIMRVTDFDKLSLKDDKLENVDSLKAEIEKDWSGFILQKKMEGAPVPTPPGNNGDEKKDPPSRAAEIAAKYRENIYGKQKEN